MTKVRLAAAAAAAFFLCSSAQAEANLGALFQREQTNLQDVPSDRFSRFFEPSRKTRQAKGENVDFTNEWLDARPKAKGDAQFACLAEALYFEARGETVKGQFAVAEVIMNRVKSAQFPNTACKVVNQGTGRKHQCQFSYTCDGHKEIIAEKRAYERVAKVARAVLDGTSTELTNGATYYHTTAVRPRWSRSFTHTIRIGVHKFYRDDRFRTAAKN
ncbi:cell wall hydrolase [Epibacterium sp. SM1969]|uniref:Cell wall hydrolase n=1 Tax=Tritonibacter aquimaris TaxID=2663379 RepID=A0A844AM18_9RHOB|nr:cell wall hydrolase [Tritonibacter aquimaris]MQY43135.1 cell wall hydrolase [Tritonibacter aquimaris]